MSLRNIKIAPYVTTDTYYVHQGMSCKGACAHAHVQCAVTHVRVRVKSILKSVRDVRACGSFLGV